MPIRFDAIPGGSFTFNDGNDIPKIGLGISRIVDQVRRFAVSHSILSMSSARFTNVLSLLSIFDVIVLEAHI